MRRALAFPLLLLIACGGDDIDMPPINPDAFDPSVAEPMFSHRFEEIPVLPGQEFNRHCQTITLNNEDPIYVSRVTTNNTGAFHHSNWFYVPEDKYPGEDGTWRCRDREYDEIGAAAAGGVLFAQSTQSVTDEQAFPEGVAFVIPPYSKILGQVHLLNVTSEPIDASIEVNIEFIAQDDVHTLLNPFSFTILDLDIQPRSKSRFTMDCDMRSGASTEFDIHYVLPHYHVLGTGLSMVRIGGPRDGEDIFRTDIAIGEPSGVTIDPALPFDGAEGVRLSCTYDNPRDTSARYGIGDNEMCQFLAYTTAPNRFAGASAPGSLEFIGEVDGVREYKTGCFTVALPGDLQPARSNTAP